MKPPSKLPRTLLCLLALLALNSCSHWTSPERLQHVHAKMSRKHAMATIIPRLDYCGTKNSFHHFRLKHGGLDFSTDYRVALSELDSRIQMDYTRDESSWPPCRIEGPDAKARYTIVPQPWLTSPPGNLFDPR